MHYTDLTKMAPQLQDLGQYHFSRFPQYRLQPLCIQSSKKAQIIAHIVQECIRVPPVFLGQKYTITN